MEPGGFCPVNVLFRPRNVLVLSPLEGRGTGPAVLGAEVFPVSFCAIYAGSGVATGNFRATHAEGYKEGYKYDRDRDGCQPIITRWPCSPAPGRLQSLGVHPTGHRLSREGGNPEARLTSNVSYQQHPWFPPSRERRDGGQAIAKHFAIGKDFAIVLPPLTKSCACTAVVVDWGIMVWVV